MNVHELEANRTGISFFHDAEKIAEFHALATAEKRRGSFFVHVCFAETKGFRSQARVGLRLVCKRIDVCLCVAKTAIVFDNASNLGAEIWFTLRCQLIIGRSSSCVCPAARWLGNAERKSLEKDRPLRIYGVRVSTPTSIHFVEQISIQARAYGLFHGTKLCLRSSSKFHTWRYARGSS